MAAVSAVAAVDTDVAATVVADGGEENNSWPQSRFTQGHYNLGLNIVNGVRYWRETFSIHNLFRCDAGGCPCKQFFNHENWKNKFEPFVTRVFVWMDALADHLAHPGSFLDESSDTFEDMRHDYWRMTTEVYEQLVVHAACQRVRILSELCGTCEQQAERLHAEALRLVSFNTPASFTMSISDDAGVPSTPPGICRACRNLQHPMLAAEVPPPQNPLDVSRCFAARCDAFYLRSHFSQGSTASSLPGETDDRRLARGSLFSPPPPLLSPLPDLSSGFDNIDLPF